MSVEKSVIRQSIRLNKDIWEAIDQLRDRRHGNISRNTWVAEAIMEKLAREETEGDKVQISLWADDNV